MAPPPSPHRSCYAPFALPDPRSISPRRARRAEIESQRPPPTAFAHCVEPNTLDHRADPYPPLQSKSMYTNDEDEGSWSKAPTRGGARHKSKPQLHQTGETQPFPWPRPSCGVVCFFAQAFLLLVPLPLLPLLLPLFFFFFLHDLVSVLLLTVPTISLLRAQHSQAWTKANTASASRAPPPRPPTLRGKRSSFPPAAPRR